MLKQYLVVSYGYLVKVGAWDLEPITESAKKVVPEEYRVAVAGYLAEQTILQ